MIGRVYAAALAVALLGGCSMTSASTQAELTVSGPAPAVSAFLADYASRHRTVQSSGTGAMGKTTAKIVLPSSVTAKEVTVLMTRAIDADLSVAYKGPSRSSNLVLKLA